MPRPGSQAPTRTASLHEVAVVAIGRNEGERLRRCLDALPDQVRGVVYVDSGSTDGSVEEARRRGFEVVELDMSIPFTAARARNAGLRRLHERWPDLRFVQFIDADCTLVPGWLDVALLEIDAHPDLAVVCGRRREVRPDRSIYNRLCDIEWDAPPGEVRSCGGDALARVAALGEVGGFDDGVIAGEEPELCARLRASGWRIRRIAREMTLHDAAMTHFGQWWRRSVRSGHGFAEVSARHPDVFQREMRSAVAWTLLLPTTFLSAPLLGHLALALLLMYPLQWARIALRRRAGGDDLRHAGMYATLCIVGKFPECLGAVRYWWNRARGRESRLIEYK